MLRKRLIFMDAKLSKLETNDLEFLSVAFVTDSDSKLYLEIEQPHAEVDGWAKKNILPKLEGHPVSKEEAKEKILSFVEENYDNYEKPTLIADKKSFNWLGLCHLFGICDIPFHEVPLDFATMLFMNSIDPDIPREALAWKFKVKVDGQKHHALYHAQLLKRLYEKIVLGW